MTQPTPFAVHEKDFGTYEANRYVLSVIETGVLLIEWDQS